HDRQPGRHLRAAERATARAAVALARRAALVALGAAAGTACRAGDRGASVTDASSYPPPFSIAALDRIGIGSQGSTGWTEPAVMARAGAPPAAWARPRIT